MFFYWIVTAFALLYGISALQGLVSYRRGTNSVSRYIRDNTANMLLKRAVVSGMFQTFVSFLLLAIGSFKLTELLLPLPGLCIVVGSLLLQYKQNTNITRVSDSRVVTKGALDVAGATAKTTGTALGVGVGAIAIAATGGAATPVVIGTAVGSGLFTAGVVEGVGKSMETASIMMKDVSSLDIDENREFGEATGVARKITGVAGKILDTQLSDAEVYLINNAKVQPDKFIEAANDFGIQGTTVEEIAMESLKLPAVLSQLDGEGLEPTVENVIPVVTRALNAAGKL